MAWFAWGAVLWPLDDSYAFRLSSFGWLRVAAVRSFGWQVPGLILAAIVYSCILGLVPSRRWLPLLITAACCGIYPITVAIAGIVFLIERPFF